MGRPLYPKGNLRAKAECYLSPAEREEVAAKACAAHLAVSAFLRKAALGQRVQAVPTGNAERWAELAKLAANLNQLAHHANAGQCVGVPASLLNGVVEEVLALRRELLGGGEP